MSYTAIPKEIVLWLYDRYDEEDIAVLADWCEEHGADQWAEDLRQTAEKYIQAWIVCKIAEGFKGFKTDIYALHWRWIKTR